MSSRRAGAERVIKNVEQDYFMSNDRGSNWLAHLPLRALAVELTRLRTDFDNLATRPDAVAGTDVVNRAEQVSAAIQRLQWALKTRLPRCRSASSGN